MIDAAKLLSQIEVRRDDCDHVWLVIDGIETVGLPRGEDADRLMAWGRRRDKLIEGRAK